MAPALPDDILHLLCEQLGDQEQFDALFNCACASRSLAIPALSNLYRYVFMLYHLESMHARVELTLTTSNATEILTLDFIAKLTDFIVLTTKLPFVAPIKMMSRFNAP
jgi:hypothetical protein